MMDVKWQRERIQNGRGNRPAPSRFPHLAFAINHFPSKRTFPDRLRECRRRPEGPAPVARGVGSFRGARGFPVALARLAVDLERALALDRVAGLRAIVLHG